MINHSLIINMYMFYDSHNIRTKLALTLHYSMNLIVSKLLRTKHLRWLSDRSCTWMRKSVRSW